MAATVIDGYSTQLAQIQPPAYAPLKPNEQEGRIRIAYFSLTLASQAAGFDAAVLKLPKGARILGGLIVASATLASSAQVSVGLMGKDGSGFIDAAGAVSDAVASLKAAAVLSTTQVPFAITQALRYGYETEKEVYITLTTSVGTVSTEVITGEVRYVVD
jgi:hypothetical protein